MSDVQTMIEESNTFVTWLAGRLSRIPLDVGTSQKEAAVMCFGTVIEHHGSIVYLMGCFPQKTTSAIALLRPQWEAYIRGFWLMNASAVQAQKWFNNEKLPSVEAMIRQIEANSDLGGREKSPFLKFHEQSWKALCGYTHTGPEYLRRWTGRSTFEPVYEDRDVVQILDLSNRLGYLASTAIGLSLIHI